jgi:hypothetical protein
MANPAIEPLIQQARIDVKLEPVDKQWVDMTWDEQQRYQKRLAELIATNAANLPPDAVTASQVVLNRGVLPAPESYGVTDAIGDFGSEVGSQVGRAGESVAGIGNGLLNTLSAMKWLIPLAVVAWVAIKLFGEVNKAKANANPAA